MIYPKIEQAHTSVMKHYDELDPIYREIWGDHLHHGLWITSKESPKEAVINLVDLIIENINLSPGERICDIGCGYGGTARQIAQNGGVVSGVTISPKQYHFAANQKYSSNVTFFLEDWLNNSFSDQSFDAVIAIESSEHMSDKIRFFEEAYRVLKPGGRLIICAWLASETPTSWQIKHLLEPICREGHLPSMGTPNEYIKMMQNAGFCKDIKYSDLTNSVRKTWNICLRRLCTSFFCNPLLIKYLINPQSKEIPFIKSLLRIKIAYQTRAMSYGFFKAVK